MSSGSHWLQWLRLRRQDGPLLADIERAFRRDSDPGTDRGFSDFNQVANNASPALASNAGRPAAVSAFETSQAVGSPKVDSTPDA
jgi:hypothetical protein